MNCLEWWADLSQIVTGAIAVITGGWYFGSGYCRIRRLNSYLQAARDDALKRGKKGQHTALHLMSRVGLTEEQLFRASFWSCHVRRHIRKGKDGMASHILFSYKD